MHMSSSASMKHLKLSRGRSRSRAAVSFHGCLFDSGGDQAEGWSFFTGQISGRQAGQISSIFRHNQDFVFRLSDTSAGMKLIQFFSNLIEILKFKEKGFHWSVHFSTGSACGRAFSPRPQRRKRVLVPA